MTTQRAFAEWYTLVRFQGTPNNLTAVAQTRTAGEALALLHTWEVNFPDETGVVFDQRNAPVTRASLALDAQHEQPPVPVAGR